MAGIVADEEAKGGNRRRPAKGMHGRVVAVGTAEAEWMGRQSWNRSGRLAAGVLAACIGVTGRPAEGAPCRSPFEPFGWLGRGCVSRKKGGWCDGGSREQQAREAGRTASPAGELVPQRVEWGQAGEEGSPRIQWFRRSPSSSQGAPE